jgi:hypothetical protein
MKENPLHFVPATGILCVVIFVSKEAGSQTKKNRKKRKEAIHLLALQTIHSFLLVSGI